MSRKTLLAISASLILTAPLGAANAYEFGASPWAQKPGITMGASAGVPPPGLYMFNQVFTYQANLTGPGNLLLNPNGTKTGAQAAVATTGLLWVPGWTFLGGTYNAVLVQPVAMDSVGSPTNVQQSGLIRTYIVPAELSWKLGDSGFFVKAGLGMDVPDGTKTGANGLGNVGSPWWTFQPELAVSYLKDGWNLTAFLFDEINTKSSVTGYKSGDVFHAELSATKTLGNWTLGPVGYYVGQISDDKSSAFYNYAINVNRYNIYAAGGLVGYNFGPASVNVWAFSEFSSNASGGTAAPRGLDSATITKGFSVFASINYRLWAPDENPGPARRPQFTK